MNGADRHDEKAAPDHRPDAMPETPADASTVLNGAAETETIDGLLRQLAQEPDQQFLDEKEYQEILERLCQLQSHDYREQAQKNLGQIVHPKKVGQFKILHRLGQGGMGVVYKALQPKLQRPVALKILSLHRDTDDRFIKRFEQEIRAVGRLNHPNIIQAFDAGEADGKHYLVMEYFDGLDLSSLLHRTGPLSVADACEIIRQAAQGLQHAYRQGLVHRDIKPSNLMLGTVENGSTCVKLLDLGLALLESSFGAESRELTASGQMMGTLDYMAPEQCNDSHEVNIRADIYSLGATLYRLLCGKPPYSGEKFNTRAKLLFAVAGETPPPSIVKNCPEAPQELALIVARMLSHNPQERFASPEEVSDALLPFATKSDLEKLLAQARTTADQVAIETKASNETGTKWSSESLDNDESLGSREAESCGRERTTIDQKRVLSQVPQSSPHSGRWRPRKNSVQLLCMGILMLAMLVPGVVLTLRTPHGEVVIELSDGVDAKSVKVEVSGDGEVHIADATQGWTIDIDEGQYKARLVAGQDLFQLTENRIVVQRGRQTRLIVSIRAPENLRQDAVLVPLNQASESQQVPSSIKQPSRLPGSGERPSDADLLKRLTEVNWKPGEAATLPGYTSFPSKIPGMQFDWQILPTLAHWGYQASVSPKATYVAMWHDPVYDPYIRIVERTTGRLVGVFYGNTRYERKIAWSPDETRFVVSWWNWSRSMATVCRLDGTVLEEWPEEADHALSPEWSHDGSRILFVDQTSIRQRTPDGQIVATFQPPGHGGETAEHLLNSFWSPDGKRFAVATNGEVRIYPTDGGEPIAVLKDKNGLALYRHSWHPSGDKILTNGHPVNNEMGAARLWTLSGDYIRFGFRRLHEVFQAFSPDGRFFVTNYGDVRNLSDNTLANLDVSGFGYIQQGREIVRWTDADRMIWFTSNKGPGYSIEFSPSGKELAEYQLPMPLQQHSLSWMLDPNRFVTIGGHLRLEEKNKKQFYWGTTPEVDEVTEQEKGVGPFVAFSPDGKHYAGLGTNAVEIYDIEGKIRQELQPLYNNTLRSWSQNSETLAVAHGGYEGGPIEIWLGTQKVAVLNGHKSEIRGLCWSPVNNSLLAVWDGDQNVFIWDIQSPDEPIVKKQGFGFQFHPRNNHWFFDSTCPRWSPDGKLLAIPIENSIVLVSPTSGDEITIPWEKKDVGLIWWQPEGKSLLVDRSMIDLQGKVIGKLKGFGSHPIPFFNVLGNGKAVGAGHRLVAIWDDYAQPATDISLPGFEYGGQPRVSMLSRGLNARRISPTGRYLIHHSGVTATSPNSSGGGDIYFIDLQEKQHLWTGLGYTDGTQVRIEPTGRVQGTSPPADSYLTYVIRYPTGRILPLTQLQFAARIGLSPGQQFVQQILDLGGTVSIAGRTEPVAAVDLKDARDLPDLATIERLDLHGTSITDKGLAILYELKQLRVLNISGLKVTNALGTMLPESLEELDVSNTDTGDFLLTDLRSLKSLKRLVLTGTKVSAEGIAAFKAVLPNCVIESNVTDDETGAASDQ